MLGKRTQLLAVSFLVGALTIATAPGYLPIGARATLGIAMVFLVPGFALVCAVLPDGQLSSAERLLASVGLSLAVAVGVAVVLAALPVGLTRTSFAFVLGSTTVGLTGTAAFRGRFSRSANRKHEPTKGGS